MCDVMLVEGAQQKYHKTIIEATNTMEDITMEDITKEAKGNKTKHSSPSSIDALFLSEESSLNNEELPSHLHFPDFDA
jgi:hypothetical protein